ncbi:ester cyclase [Salinispora sp. H7-4]|uniref:ester cyclase n=1 Tax=Salinispora sp. H7-4 TaxID=2748321 RepID=UPI0015D2A2C9|nr:ester cyclase [Salinispora sp. H7-4]NYT95295.1 ester cyclase [Salinispora sp. H7-4]
MSAQLLPRTLAPTMLAPDLTQPVRAFIDAVNAGDMTAALAQLSPDAVHHGQIASYRPEGVRVLFNLLRNVLPDMRMEIRDIRVDGDRVTTRVVGTGTHSGAFLGQPPSHRPIVWQMVDVATVRREPASDGSAGRPVVTERYWDVFADPYAWQEIGVIPAIMC